VGDPGAPPRHAADPAILAWCEARRAILVTNNRRSVPAHLRDHVGAGRSIPGIFVLSPHLGIGATAEELIAVAGASFEDEYRDQIRYLPLLH
jgi:hypothetical protein